MTRDHDFHHDSSHHRQALSNQYTFDPDEYTDCLDALEMSETQKRDVLYALFHIMRIFVDIGFGRDSVQLIEKSLENSSSRDSEKLVQQFEQHNIIH